MPAANATLDELNMLVSRLPGVSVECCDIRTGHLCIVMRIEQLESLASIVYCSDAANVPLDIWSTAPSEPIIERSNPMHLRYRIRTKDAEDSLVTGLESLQTLGVFLVWHLHEIGLLDSSEANRLLCDWNGKLVSS